MNFAVLASGHGGNLQAIINAVKSGRIKADLKVVISDKKNAYALKRAQRAKIPAVYIDPKKFATRESFDKEIIGYLQEFEVDFVVLAGYMRLLSKFFVKFYPNKILNIHPSLLPSFKGTDAIKEAFEGGVKVTGPTVHFVVEEVDAGAIILQEPVIIAPKDSMAVLEKKIHEAEHRIYPQAIDLFVRGQLKIKGRKVTVL